MGHEHQPKAKIMKALAKVERGREPGPKGKDPFDTDEKKIAELRKQRDPALGCIAVNRFDFIDALFRAYDTEKVAVAHLGPACSALLKRAEEAEARAEKAEKDLHFALLDKKAAGVSEVDYDVYAAAGKVLGCDRDQAKRLFLATLAEPAKEATLNANAEADRHEEWHADVEAGQQEESTS